MVTTRSQPSAAPEDPSDDPETFEDVPEAAPPVADSAALQALLSAISALHHRGTAPSLPAGLPLYDGDSPTRLDPNAYLGILDDAFFQHPDEARLREVYRFLHPGNTLAWWSTARLSINTYEEFKSAFRAKFSDPHRLNTALAEFEHAKQGAASVPAFFDKLKTLQGILQLDDRAVAIKFHLGAHPALAKPLNEFLANRRAQHVPLPGEALPWYPPLEDLYGHALIHAGSSSRSSQPIGAISDGAAPSQDAAERFDRLEKAIHSLVSVVASGRGQPQANAFHIVTWEDVRTGRAPYLPKFADLPAEHQRFLKDKGYCLSCRMRTDHATAQCEFRPLMDKFFRERKAKRAAKGGQDFPKGPSE